MIRRVGTRVQLPSERRRVAIAATVGLAAGLSIAWAVPWELSVLVGWDVTVATLLAWVWVTVGGLDHDETARVAMASDNSRQSTRILLLSAAVASLGGVAVGIHKANALSGWVAVAMTTASVLTVILSWALVHTLFALRYTRLYFADQPGGIDFKNDTPPDFLDFAYVAFTVGMTFQVSDTDIQKRSIRRAVLRHALLSYIFGTVIIAVTINIIAGFVK
jgi:uncharacterized membrane protein